MQKFFHFITIPFLQAGRLPYTMNLTLLSRLGDWNPQMFRELKGRLITRNVAIAVITSLIVQFLTVSFFYIQLPVKGDAGSNIYSRYCTGRDSACLRDAVGNLAIDWSIWWLDLFRVFSWILPVILLLGAVYMLISDIAQEERRGTLNFIRLSPQSSQEILIGKILGVPALLYLAIAVAVPLHWWSAIAGGVHLSVILSLYVFLCAVCCFFYSAALLYALLGGNQAGVGSILSLGFGLPCVQIINFYLYAITDNNGSQWKWLLSNNLQWFYLRIGSNLALTYSFALLNCVVWTYWIWQALNRRFCNPSGTIISKKQSYWLVACSQGWILGFLLPALQSTSANSKEGLFIALGVLCTCNLIWFLVLITALSPQRQALQDWARYRRDSISHRQGFWKSDLVQDLIWAEKSPALVAIALNLAMTAVIWVAWILLWPAGTSKLQAICGLLLSLNLILIYAAIAELLLFMKTRKRNFWAAGTIGTTILLPPIILSALSSGAPHGTAAALLLFSPFLWAAIDQVSATTIFFVFLGQLSIVSLLSLQITRKLKLAGESASKALLAGNKS